MTDPVQIPLGSLADVDLTGAQPGSALVIGADGIWRPRPADTAFGFDYLYDAQHHDGISGIPIGRIRFDTQDPGAAEHIFIGNGTPFGQGDPNAWIQAWNRIDNDPKGYLTIRRPGEPLAWSVYWVHEVTHLPFAKAVSVTLGDRQNEPCSADFARVTVNFFMAGNRGADAPMG